MKREEIYGRNRLGRDEMSPDGFSPLGVGIIVTLQNVGEEKELDDAEENQELYNHESPKRASDSHLPESVAIHFYEKSKCIHGP